MLFISSFVKAVLWAVFVLSGIGLLLLYLLPSAMVPGGRQNGLPPALGEETWLTGVVKDYGSNRNGDIDQLLVSSAGKEAWVRFPPHTAKRVLQLAGKGQTVTLLVNSGPPHPPCGPAAHYQLVQIQSGDAVLPVAETPPPPPAAGKPVELSGPVESLLTGNHGEVTGLLLNNCRVALPPHLAQSIAPLLQQGKPITIQGYERNTTDGFVNMDSRRLIKPYRLTIDSTDYLL